MATKLLRQGHSITTPAEALESLEYPAAHVRDMAVGTIRTRKMMVDRDARTASQIRLDTLLDTLVLLTVGSYRPSDEFGAWREGLQRAIKARAAEHL